jgi:hypothetical protein
MASKLREQLQRAVDHHITQGKVWKAVGEGHTKLAAMGGDAADVHKTMAESCNKATEDHASQATFCMSCLKAMDDADLNKIIPDRVSSVAATDTPSFGIRAVPRAGAPMIDAAVDKANVPVMFRHLIADPDEV